MTSSLKVLIIPAQLLRVNYAQWTACIKSIHSDDIAKKKKDSQIPDIIAKIMAKSVKVIYEGFHMQ